MPSRWLFLLALGAACIAPANKTFAQFPPPVIISPIPESIPAPTDLPAAPASEPLAGITGAGPCECLVNSTPGKPWYEPETFQFLTGYSYKVNFGPKIPAFEYVPATARFGWYLTDPIAPGAISVQFGTTSGIVTQSFGNYFTGPSLGIRYERRPDRDLVPYFQIGSGIAFNDAFKDHTQRAIGSNFEFCDQFEGGVRWRVASNWSLDMEVAYMHISNAGFASRNYGANNVALLAGITYMFGCR